MVLNLIRQLLFVMILKTVGNYGYKFHRKFLINAIYYNGVTNCIQPSRVQ